MLVGLTSWEFHSLLAFCSMTIHATAARRVEFPQETLHGFLNALGADSELTSLWGVGTTVVVGTPTYVHCVLTVLERTSLDVQAG